MKCSGNSTQFCGGSNRINIYQYLSKAIVSSILSSTASPTPTPTLISSSIPLSTSVSTSTPKASSAAPSVASSSPSLAASSTPPSTATPKVGWVYQGCYVDNAGGRSLPYGATFQGDLTNDKCRTACRAAGYIYAGTEYGGECYCGNALQNGGAPASDGEAGCNMACKGTVTETCGGPNRLTLWRYFTGNEGTQSSTLTSALPSSSRLSSSLASSAAPSSSAAPVPSGLPTGFAYKGCYVDGPGFRIMQNQQPDDQAMTVASCSTKCAGLGYSVAAMEYGVQVSILSIPLIALPQ